MSTATKPQTLAQAIAALNDAQRQAVTAPPGPVLVMAGPGTGKTQILTLRIAHRIAGGPESDAIDPANILCITFTEAGATAMRQRLRELLGPAAYSIEVRTYHGFANEVIRDNPNYFGSHRNLRLISPLEKRRIFRRLWAQLPPHSPLKKLGFPGPREISNLERLQEDLAKDNLNPADLIAACRERMGQLPTDPEMIYKRGGTRKDGSKYAAGEPRQDLIEKEQFKLERTMAAAELIAHYPAAKAEAGLFDFNDMVQWVVDAFQTHSDLLTEYQEKYQFILVDEFQDSNAVQTQLLYLLLDNPAHGDNPDVFIVGDDDQSIYRFQGANLDNFNAFVERYGHTLTFVGLKDNYRGTQPLLDPAAALIDHANPERLIYNPILSERFGQLSKTLKAHPKYSTPKPRIVEFETQADEQLWVALEVKRLIDSGLQPETIAILSRKNRALESMADLLQELGIPCSRNRSLDALQHPVGRTLVEILRHLVTLRQALAARPQEVPQADAAFSQLLLLPIWDLSALHLQLFFGRFQAAWRSGEGGAVTSRSLTEWVKSQTPDSQLDAAFWQQIDLLLEKFAEWARQLDLLPVNRLLSSLLNECGNLRSWLLGPEVVHTLPVVQALQSFFEEWAERLPQAGTAALLSLLNEYADEEFQLDYSPLGKQARGVVLSTLHGSKGLQYRQVFIVNLVHEPPLSTRFTLPEGFRQVQDNGELNDERRLLYVGLTRAEEALTLTWAKTQEGRKRPQKFHAVVEEIYAKLHGMGLWEQSTFTPSDAFAAQQLELQRNRWLTLANPHWELLEPTVMDSLLENYRLSPTDLNVYLTCPRLFYFSRLLRVPGYREDRLQYGNVVHKALEEFFKRYQARLKTEPEASLPPAEELVQEFDFWLDRYRGLFTADKLEHYQTIGRDHLTRYYHEREHTWVRDRTFWLEYPLEAEYEGVPLKGKIDKLVFTPTGTIVVDYKTGKPDERKFDPPSEKNPEGGEYWRQLVFYHFLLADKPFQQGSVTVAGDYLQPKEDEPKPFKFITHEVTPTDVEALGIYLTTTWEGIRTRRFPTIAPEVKESKDSPCLNCAYARVCWR